MDSVRGIAILFMIPLHLFLFGGGAESLVGEGGGGGGSSEWAALMAKLIVVNTQRPLGSGLVLFFFITGVALSLMLLKYKGKGLKQIEVRVLKRYGLYILAGIAMSLLFRAFNYLQTPGAVFDPISWLYWTFRSFMDLSGPILGLGVSAIIAFPIIFKWDWKKLAFAGLVLAVIEAAAIYLIPFERHIVTNFFITNSFSVGKGLPLVLFGAAVGKWMGVGRKLDRRVVAVSAAVTLGYFIVPTLLGSGGWHMIIAVWAFPHAAIFIAAAGIFSLAIFQKLEERGTRLGAFQALGRSSFIVYYGHYLILMILNAILGLAGVKVTLIMSVGELVISTATIWLLIYYFSKRRWGPPSTW